MPWKKQKKSDLSLGINFLLIAKMEAAALQRVIAASQVDSTVPSQVSQVTVKHASMFLSYYSV